MKKVRKILAIVLTFILSVTAFSIGASAEGTAAGDESLTVTVSTDLEAYAAGDIVTVNVNVASNYNLTAFRYPVMFDSDVYELPTLINLTAYNSCKTNGTINANSSNDGSFVPSNYDTSKFGCILVQWTASVVNAAVGCINNPTGELCFSFQLKTKTSAVGKTGTIFIPSESDLFYYQAIQDTTDANTFYYMDASTLVSSFVPANASVIGEDVKLIPNSDYSSTAVVDDDNLYVYGFPSTVSSNATLKNCVSATGNAVIRSVPTTLGYGTGTKINLQVDDSIVKTYVVIYFGDINGDLSIDSIDLSKVVNVAAQVESINDTAVKFAADVNGDSCIDSIDSSILSSVAAGAAIIDQAKPY